MSLPIVLHVCQLMLCMDCESEIKIYYYILNIHFQETVMRRGKRLVKVSRLNDILDTARQWVLST